MTSAKRPIYGLGFLATLLIVNSLSYMDRSLFGIMAESIKRDLHLSDSQLGIGGGAAFMFVYTLFALPMARLADREKAKIVLVLSLVGWCVMSSLIGIAHSFTLLVVARMGLAFGEAGVLPACQGLIGRNIPFERRGRALSIFFLGAPIGTGLALLIGGASVGLLGWRMTALIIPLSGLLCVPLILRYVGGTSPKTAAAAEDEPALAGPKFTAALAEIWKSAPYRTLWFAGAFAFAAISAYYVYAAPFLIRRFGMSTAEAGRFLSLCFGASGFFGTLAGGWIYDRRTRLRPSNGLVIPAIALAICSVLGIACWLSHSAALSLFCFSGVMFCYATVTPALYAAVQHVVHHGNRATGAATFNVGLGLAGGASGPVIVGVLSDHFHASLSEAALGTALAIIAAAQLIGAILLMETSRRMRTLD